MSDALTGSPFFSFALVFALSCSSLASCSSLCASRISGTDTSWSSHFASFSSSFYNIRKAQKQLNFSVTFISSPAIGHIYALSIEWMNVFIYCTHHISCLMAVYNSFEWDWMSACEGASGCRSQFIFDLKHPPNPCMKCRMKLEIDHHTGYYVPYSFR